MKVFVSTHPFSTTSNKPFELLKHNKFDVRLNSFNHKISTEELVKEIKDADIIIAGTEKITEEVLNNAPNLKLIARVGIGIDGVDLSLCRKYKIRVTYTPDAPTLAVAELCIGLIIDLARQITVTNNRMMNKLWHRHMGILLYSKTVGIIGLGRIGKSLAYLLSSFNVKLLAHDLKPDLAFSKLHNIQYVNKEELLKSSDIISVNIPLKQDTLNYVTFNELSLMKPSAFLINTARGGIVNERDLYSILQSKKIAGAAIDVFEEEPYKGGILASLDNCILTSHMGASTIDSRTDMETQAVMEAIRFKQNKPLLNEVFKNA